MQGPATAICSCDVYGNMTAMIRLDGLEVKGMEASWDGLWIPGCVVSYARERSGRKFKDLCGALDEERHS